MVATESEVLNTIRDLLVSIRVVEKDNAEEVTPESTWEDVDADSLDQVEVVKGLEDAYQITISEEAMKPVASVGDAIRVVVELIEAKEAAPA